MAALLQAWPVSNAVDGPPPSKAALTCAASRWRAEDQQQLQDASTNTWHSVVDVSSCVRLIHQFCHLLQVCKVATRRPSA